MPELDFAQQHDYSGSDLAKLLPLVYNVFTDKAPGKPVLLAELGLGASGADAQPALEAIQFHNGIWAAPFSGFAGTAMHWWWDSFVDPQKQWGEYKGLAEFLKGQDLAPLAPAKVQVEPASATALSLQSKERALVWVRSDAYVAAEGTKAYLAARQGGQAPAGWKYQPPTIEGLKVTLTGLADGAYTAHWFTPATAEWQADQQVQVQAGTITLAVPRFAQDLAVQIVAANPTT
jgi:hypothetical protein